MQRAINGSLEGGAALKRHLQTIEKQLGQGAHVIVGFLDSATYPAKHVEAVTARFKSGKTKKISVDGKSQQSFDNEYGSSRGGLPVATVAFWSEFGTVRSPARPFFRTMVDSKSPRWGIGLGVALKQTNYNARDALAIMGEGIRGQLRRSIRDWTTPPNSPKTVALKGFNKPLIDTAVMIRSADYQVIDGDVEGQQA